MERLCIFQMTDKSVPVLSSALYSLYFSLFVPGFHWSKTPLSRHISERGIGLHTKFTLQDHNSSAETYLQGKKGPWGPIEVAIWTEMARNLPQDTRGVGCNTEIPANPSWTWANTQLTRP